MQARNDGGAQRLLTALTQASHCIRNLRSMEDVDALTRALFNQPLDKFQQPDFDPIDALLQQQLQQRRQQQEDQWLQQQQQQQQQLQQLHQSAWAPLSPMAEAASVYN
jgi:hypothetical protein